MRLSHIGKPRTRSQIAAEGVHDRPPVRPPGTPPLRGHVSAPGAGRARGAGRRASPADPGRPQLQVATCGAAGAVCTHLKGCCEGLVCATSHINPNYGVCIPGEGEHLAVTTQLVVPASDGVVAQLAAELAETEEAGAAAAEVLEARQTAKDDRRTKRRSRKDTQRSKHRSRARTRTAATSARAAPATRASPPIRMTPTTSTTLTRSRPEPSEDRPSGAGF